MEVAGLLMALWLVLATLVVALSIVLYARLNKIEQEISILKAKVLIKKKGKK